MENVTLVMRLLDYQNLILLWKEDLLPKIPQRFEMIVNYIKRSKKDAYEEFATYYVKWYFWSFWKNILVAFYNRGYTKALVKSMEFQSEGTKGIIIL